MPSRTAPIRALGLRRRGQHVGVGADVAGGAAVAIRSSKCNARAWCRQRGVVGELVHRAGLRAHPLPRAPAERPPRTGRTSMTSRPGVEEHAVAVEPVAARRARSPGSSPRSSAACRGGSRSARSTCRCPSRTRWSRRPRPTSSSRNASCAARALVGVHPGVVGDGAHALVLQEARRRLGGAPREAVDDAARTRGGHGRGAGSPRGRAAPCARSPCAPSVGVERGGSAGRRIRGRSRGVPMASCSTMSASPRRASPWPSAPARARAGTGP